MVYFWYETWWPHDIWKTAEHELEIALQFVAPKRNSIFGMTMALFSLCYMLLDIIFSLYFPVNGIGNAVQFTRIGMFQSESFQSRLHEHKLKNQWLKFGLYYFILRNRTYNRVVCIRKFRGWDIGPEK